MILMLKSYWNKINALKLEWLDIVEIQFIIKNISRIYRMISMELVNMHTRKENLKIYFLI